MEEAGLLHRPADEVYSALVHDTLHRQLGITAADEACLAWLLSIALLDDGPREPFFTDNAQASDRRYHEQSKYFVFRGEDQMADESVGPVLGRQQLRHAGRTVALPAPGARADAPGLAEVLLARRSTHGRYQGRFSLDELSTLLHYSAGTATDKKLPGSSSTYRVRTYPSGGANYPVRLLMYCHAVEGVERGTYLYDPEAHALELLSAGDISPQLLQTSPWLDPRVPAPKATGSRRRPTARCGSSRSPTSPTSGWRTGCARTAWCSSSAGTWHRTCRWWPPGWAGPASGSAATWTTPSTSCSTVDGVNSSVMYVYLIGDVPAEA